MSHRYSFEKLDAWLESFPEDAEHMRLEEIDGFLAGVLSCPDMIMPSQWMPHIWSRDGKPGSEPVFKDINDANRKLKLIMDHYNSIAAAMLPGDKAGYQPVMSMHEKTGEAYCVFWILGFQRALEAWPDSWLKVMTSNDPDATQALAGLQRLVSILASKNTSGNNIDTLLEAPDHIANWIEAIAWWRMSYSPVAPVSAQKAFRDTGRNDPCPCGSGRKYKKCHGAN
jgi:uncharacterized protein